MVGDLFAINTLKQIDMFVIELLNPLYVRIIYLVYDFFGKVLTWNVAVERVPLEYAIFGSSDPWKFQLGTPGVRTPNSEVWFSDYLQTALNLVQPHNNPFKRHTKVARQQPTS